MNQEQTSEPLPLAVPEVPTLSGVGYKNTDSDPQIPDCGFHCEGLKVNGVESRPCLVPVRVRQARLSDFRRPLTSHIDRIPVPLTTYLSPTCPSVAARHHSPRDGRQQCPLSSAASELGVTAAVLHALKNATCPEGPAEPAFVFLDATTTHYSRSSVAGLPSIS
jgi:hypothetical protein